MDQLTAAASMAAGLRRNEDIALDLLKFIASMTGSGRSSGSATGFTPTNTKKDAEDAASHLLELYGRCLQAVGGSGEAASGAKR